MTGLEALRREKWWLAVNVAGVLLFLALASTSWVEPEVRDIAGAAGGGAVVWGVTALPVLGFAALVVAGRLLWAILHALRSGRWQSAAIVFFTALLWVGAALFDNSNHGSP